MWLAQDVPNWVTHTFRVQTDRASWATIGNSTGGWCAAMVAMLHPAQYAAAIVMGGYFRPEFSPFYYPYPPGSQLTARYDLVALSKRQPRRWLSGWRPPTQTMSPTPRAQHSSRQPSHHWPRTLWSSKMPDTQPACGRAFCRAA